MRPVTKITIFGVRLGIAVLACYWVMICVATHVPGVAKAAPKIDDKLLHFIAFFLLGGLMCYVTTSPRWIARFATIGLVGMAYAALDEMTQHLVPGRHPDAMDFVADAAGLWTAIVIYMLAKFSHQSFTTASNV